MKKIKTLKFFLDIYFQRVSYIEIIANNQKKPVIIDRLFFM